MTARRFIVRGRVQGVGFRWFTVRSARRLGLRGWVRNAADGSVEVLAAGAGESLGTLEDDLKRGPVASSVRQVTVREASEEEFDAADTGFDVRP